jgi:hypothetical protein
MGLFWLIRCVSLITEVISRELPKQVEKAQEATEVGHQSCPQRKGIRVLANPRHEFQALAQSRPRTVPERGIVGLGNPEIPEFSAADLDTAAETNETTHQSPSPRLSLTLTTRATI